MSLRREDALAFVQRDWAAVRTHKDRSMYDWVQRNGARAALELGDILHRQVAARAASLKAVEHYAGLIELRRKVTLAYARSR